MLSELLGDISVWYIRVTPIINISIEEHTFLTGEVETTSSFLRLEKEEVNELLMRFWDVDLAS